MTKKCYKCRELKQSIEFGIDKARGDGKKSLCKECAKEKTQEWRVKNPEYAKRWRAKNSEHNRQYYAQNREKIIDMIRRWRIKNPKHYQQWYIENKEKRLEYKRQYRVEHKEECLEYNRQRRIKSPEKVKEIQRKADEKQRATTKGKLRSNILRGINFSLRKGSKNGCHWEELVGYTVDQLKRHLERQFKDGMNWKNFMDGKIHIDHKIPIAVFNFKKPEDEDFKKCWALKNLQPLWKNDNLSKGAKIDKPFQPSLIF